MRLLRGPLFLILLAWTLSAAPLDLRKGAFDAVASGSAAAPAIVGRETPLLELKAVFSGAKASRACWDLPLRHDLSRCAGLRLRFRCLNADLASELLVHVNVEGGWYSASVAPSSPGSWEEVTIPKSALMPEQEACSSWRNARRLRFTAWPGAAGTFRWQFAAIDFIDANVPLAMLRAGTAEAPAEARRAAALYLRHLGNALAAGGIYPAVVEEDDCLLETLRGYSCLLAVSAETLQPHAQSVVAGYLRGGGRLGAFYLLPPPLAEAAGFPQGKFRKSDFGGLQTTGGAAFGQRSSACIGVDAAALPKGCKVRGYWNDASGRKSAVPAILSSPKGFWMTHVYLNQDPARAIPVLAAFAEEFCPNLRQNAANELLRHARFTLANAPRSASHAASQAALKKAGDRAVQHDYPGLLAAIRQFHSLLADEAIGGAAAAALPAPVWRAAWLNNPQGLPGLTWEQTAARMAAAQLNCALPCVLTPYGAAYASRFVPRAAGLAANEDALAACLASARRRQMSVHPWMKVLSVADAPAATRKSLEEAGRLQCKRNGQTVPWLCPSNPANRRLLKNLVAEICTKYAVDGIHLDMLRYAGSEYCYCENCRHAFEKSRGGAPLDRWPDCLVENAALRNAWDVFRRAQITSLADELSKAARQSRYGLQVSAAVYPDPANARSAVGQEWPAWLQNGTVDFVCPMCYRPTAALFKGDLERLQTQLGGRNAAAGKVRPGIGMAGFALDKAEVNRQILTLRNAGLDGYALFEFNHTAAAELTK